jgi:cytochrome c-type biogenesis protein CcmF
VARFQLFSGDRELAPLEASKRVYTARAMPTTEAGIRTDWMSQAYVSLGDAQDDGLAVRLYDKPLILLIWIGAIVMALGGGLSLTDRRFRLAAPRRAAPVAAAQPAE